MHLSIMLLSNEKGCYDNCEVSCVFLGLYLFVYTSGSESSLSRNNKGFWNVGPFDRLVKGLWYCQKKVLTL